MHKVFWLHLSLPFPTIALGSHSFPNNLSNHNISAMAILKFWWPNSLAIGVEGSCLVQIGPQNLIFGHFAFFRCASISCFQVASEWVSEWVTFFRSSVNSLYSVCSLYSLCNLYSLCSLYSLYSLHSLHSLYSLYSLYSLFSLFILYSLNSLYSLHILHSLYSFTSFTSFTSASSGRLSSIFFYAFPKIYNNFLWSGEEGTSVARRYKSIPRPCPGPGCLSPLLGRPVWRSRPSPCPTLVAKMIF